MADEIIYEQPLNEHIRVCLRLEYLFQIINDSIQQGSELGNRVTIATLIDILNVLDRPDLKTKLVTSLVERASNLTLLEKTPGINSQKLASILDELDHLIDYLHSSQGKLGQDLRQHDFINNIRLNAMKPAGTANFSCPYYQLWLTLPEENRQQMLVEWRALLEPISRVVDLLLNLTRSHATPQAQFANEGFYQAALDVNVPYQLIRVILSQRIKAYPEISLGRHRLAINFYTPNYSGGRAVHLTENIPFKLACCGI